MNPNISDTRFLVVDESHNDLSILNGILRSIGATDVQRTSDLFGALEILNSNEVDIVFVANAQRSEDGFELLRMIRNAKDLPDRGLHIVMTSSDSKAATIKAAIRTGSDGFLAKPFSARSVEQQVQNILEKPIPRVEFGDYFGPDRRRRVDPAFGGSDRRGADEVA